MEPLSNIANSALNDITNGQFSKLPSVAITGLLNDFQYAWLKRLKISFDFEILDIARRICSGNSKDVFKATNCKNIKDIREKFSDYIENGHPNDDRVILSLSFDGKQINSEWMELKEYSESNKKNTADRKKRAR